MKVQINQLVKSLLQKDTLEQCSVEELKQFADRHPYFGAAQLLLTKKLQTENSEEYNEELQKTFLFFHNPLWVEHLLNETGNAEIIAAEAIITTEVKEEKTATIIAEEINTPVVASFENNEPATPLSTDILTTEAPAVPDEKVAEQFIEASAIVPPETPLQKEEERLAIPAFKIEHVDPAKAELIFEPYYTVDYFASQGIKFKEEEKPKDKFGVQLKSFTDWLKIMKRLPVAEMATNIEANTEKKVEQMAEHSLEKREVITEAMAEVWEKQGNAAKAIEIYNKLSLLDPLKSAYFAAKIEALKKTN